MCFGRMRAEEEVVEPPAVGEAVGALNENEKKRKKAREEKKEDKAKKSLEATEKEAAHAEAALRKYKAAQPEGDAGQGREKGRGAEAGGGGGQEEKGRAEESERPPEQIPQGQARRERLGEEAYLAEQRAQRNNNRVKDRARRAGCLSGGVEMLAD